MTLQSDHNVPVEVDEIALRYRALTKNQKERFFENANMLFARQLESMALKGPYRLYLDSNALIRFEDMQRGLYGEGALALLLFFAFYRRQRQLRADVVIGPTVFYEFSRRQVVGTVKEHWSKFRALRDLVQSSLGTDVAFEGIETFEGAQSVTRMIEADATLLTRALADISRRDWRYDLVRRPGGVAGVVRADGMLELSPRSAADALYRPVRTEYFSPELAGLFLREHVARQIATHPKNDAVIAEKYAPDDGYALADVLHLTAGGKLRGLADVEVFAHCNVRWQFVGQAHGRYQPASIAVTMDDDLARALAWYADHGVTSATIVGGEDQEDAHAKLMAAMDDAGRLQGARDRQRDCGLEQDEFVRAVVDKFDRHSA